MLEKDFQRGLIKDLKTMFPNALVFKNEKKGLPDLTVLWNKHWAMLECKKSEADMRHSIENQPDQKYYLDWANGMSFARYIYPENRQEVLDELQQAFRTQG